MPDILHDLPITAPISVVYRALTAPDGLDAWWTKQSSGQPVVGAMYSLGFGPEFEWKATVTRAILDSEFELQFTVADADWTHTRVGFHIESREPFTWLQFRHTGWPAANEHYRISCNCWALYLRVLRRWLEYGESIPYEARLDA